MSDVTVEVIGAGRAADRFGRVRTNLRELERTAPQEVAVAAVPAYKAAAPRRTGRLVRSIHATDGLVVADAKSDKGYGYVPVSRFGHRRTGDDRIHAKLGGVLGPLSIGGRLTFRKSVRRYHPARDWADAGYFTAQRVIRRRFGELVDKAIS